MEADISGEAGGQPKLARDIEEDAVESGGKLKYK